MKKVILIGFAASYKTAVGKILANMLNCAFVDTDAEIERQCNMSVQQIFDTRGEKYFREKESELLRSLKGDGTVISCGGGAVLSPNFATFVQDSAVICLTASAETVHARLDGISRPLFDGLTVQKLSDCMQKRAPLYAQYAQAFFPTDGSSPEQVAEQVYLHITKTS